MDIKIELLKLRKSQNDLKLRLYEKGIRATSAQICLALNDDQMPKSELIRNKSREIIAEWKEKDLSFGKA